MSTTYIIIGVSVLLIILLVSTYNRFVTYKNNRENTFTDIDVQLKQRHDLIPQLIGSVKGYMDHGREVLTRVTEARNKAMGASTISDKIKSENELSSAMSSFNIQVEAHPDLKASDGFHQLQEEISDIENKLASSRRYFNSATRELNITIEKFQNNMVAGMFGFKIQEMFDLGDNQRVALDKSPDVKF